LTLHSGAKERRCSRTSAVESVFPGGASRSCALQKSSSTSSTRNLPGRFPDQSQISPDFEERMSFACSSSRMSVVTARSLSQWPHGVVSSTRSSVRS
jgi:hypothetical protein